MTQARRKYFLLAIVQVNVFYWIDGKFGYALSASIGKQELARIATDVYDQREKTE